jgi:hypothetical protein
MAEECTGRFGFGVCRVVLLLTLIMPVIFGVATMTPDDVVETFGRWFQF